MQQSYKYTFIPHRFDFVVSVVIYRIAIAKGKLREPPVNNQFNMPNCKGMIFLLGFDTT